MLCLCSYEATATLTTKAICVKTDRTDDCPAKTISETVAVVPILRQASKTCWSFFTEYCINLMPSCILHRRIMLNESDTLLSISCKSESSVQPWIALFVSCGNSVFARGVFLTTELCPWHRCHTTITPGTCRHDQCGFGEIDQEALVSFFAQH